MSNAKRQASFFEDLHRQESEPWSFSKRGVEVLRHEWVATTARALRPPRVADIGCSFGQLTRRIAEFAPELLAIDVSATAVSVAKERCKPIRPHFVAGAAMALPVACGSIDLVIASDGIYSWNLDYGERAIALSELHRITRPGGHVLLTEHTRRERFPDFISEVEASGLEIESVNYLADRPWYQVESWFKAVQHLGIVDAARRSVTIARGFRALGRLLGPVASRHICVLARRAGTASEAPIEHRAQVESAFIASS